MLRSERLLKNIQSLSNQWECAFSTISRVLLFTKMMLFTENSLTLIASHLFALTWSFSKFFLLFVCLFFLLSWVFYWFQGNWLNLLLKFTISQLERELSLELKLVIFPVITLANLIPSFLGIQRNSQKFPTMQI